MEYIEIIIGILFLCFGLLHLFTSNILHFSNARKTDQSSEPIYRKNPKFLNTRRVFGIIFLIIGLVILINGFGLGSSVENSNVPLVPVGEDNLNENGIPPRGEFPDAIPSTM